MSTKEIAVRHADAKWEGNLREGKGHVALGSGKFAGPYSYDSRFGSGPDTTPEELIAAAHSACFAMATSAQLAAAGHTATRLECTAKVTLADPGDGATITKIVLDLVGVVPGVTEAEFLEKAAAAKTGCPISKALAAVPEIVLNARLA
ncbi:MAG: OsmC family peroxiredoxin [Fimbriimonadaceae bacterium]|nr:OsmC family peroxiredoxin [Fimbriimonadaceae bacterium]